MPADRGASWIDQNAGRLPNASPLTPIFAAIDTLHESYPYSGIDLVTNRNNFRKLFRWVAGTVTKDFKIDIEHYGQRTVVFTRWEESDQEIISGFRGFGAEYRKAAARPVLGCERATGHYRVVSVVSPL